MLAALTCAVTGMQAETNKDSIKAVKPVFTVVKANKNYKYQRPKQERNLLGLFNKSASSKAKS